LVLGSISVFLLFKFFHLSFRFGDGNAYIYMAYQLGHLIPYKDFLLVDPPFFIFVLSFFKLIFGKNLLLFQILPVIFEAGTAYILFLLLKKWGNPLSFFAPIIYLFSFTVLSTSDYLTGVQLVIFLSMAAFLSWEKRKFKLSGFLWSLAILSKLYIFPAFVGFGVWIFLKEKRDIFWQVILGSILGFALILLPFLFFSFSAIFKDLIIHHLNRPAGNNKLSVLRFFLAKEWFLIFFSAFGSIVYLNFKKIIIIPSFIALLLFFLIYQDLYYLYLDNLLPYLVFSFLLTLGYFWEKGKDYKKFVSTLLFFYAIFLIFSFKDYKENFFNRGRFLNSDEIASYIKTLPGDFQLYGSHEVAPLVALKSEKQLFSNQIDTNTQLFSSGLLDRDKISHEAVQKGVYLLTRVIDRPKYNVLDFGYEGFFSKSVFDNFCRKLNFFPSTSKELDNFIGVFECKVK